MTGIEAGKVGQLGGLRAALVCRTEGPALDALRSGVKQGMA